MRGMGREVCPCQQLEGTQGPGGLEGDVGPEVGGTGREKPCVLLQRAHNPAAWAGAGGPRVKG